MNYTRHCVTLLAVVTALCLPTAVSAAPPRLLVTTYTEGVTAGTFKPAYIVLHLADSTGKPMTKPDVPKPSGDPVGGLELKGSKWRFQTLLVPPGYGANFLVPGQRGQSFLAGQVRITAINSLGNNVDGDAAAGLYILTVVPAVGVRGARKTQIPWVPGDYRFMISYIDGTDQGTTFGSFTIR